MKWNEYTANEKLQRQQQQKPNEFEMNARAQQNNSNIDW